MRIIGLAALLAAAAALSAPLLDAASRSYVVRPSEPVQTSPASQSVQGRTLAVRADASGHFLVVAVVNGRSVEALIDTGATSVTLTFEAAERLGLGLLDHDFKTPVRTANGTANMAAVYLDRIKVGPIAMDGVEALVAPRGMLEQSLLGMSFISRLEKFEMRGRQLVLKD